MSGVRIMNLGHTSVLNLDQNLVLLLSLPVNLRYAPLVTLDPEKKIVTQVPDMDQVSQNEKNTGKKPY